MEILKKVFIRRRHRTFSNRINTILIENSLGGIDKGFTSLVKLKNFTRFSYNSTCLQ
jgi:hypothetical protein